MFASLANTWAAVKDTLAPPPQEPRTQTTAPEPAGSATAAPLFQATVDSSQSSQPHDEPALHTAVGAGPAPAGGVHMPAGMPPPMADPASAGPPVQFYTPANMAAPGPAGTGGPRAAGARKPARAKYVPVADGFGTTCGNPELSAKYGHLQPSRPDPSSIGAPPTGASPAVPPPSA